MATPEIDALRAEWKTLYSETLPMLAKSRDSAQPRWPVTLDHCFARIVLDNVVGDGKQQWDKVLSKPAIRNMDEQQLQDAIALGLKIVAGHVDLCHLDEISLRCRGKNESKYARSAPKDVRSSQENQSLLSTTGTKRAIDDVGPSDDSSTKKIKKTVGSQSTLDFWQKENAGSTPATTAENSRPEKRGIDDGVLLQLKRVRSHPSLTPYRKRLYTILLSVPRGRFTTYAAMSDHLASSARAVGNGMRNNPFAPEVPCHRVLASDASIGGFHGDWGRDGKHAAKKVELLRGEGVKFDGRGKAVGQPFRDFDDFHEIADNNSKQVTQS